MREKNYNGNYFLEANSGGGGKDFKKGLKIPKPLKDPKNTLF